MFFRLILCFFLTLPLFADTVPVLIITGRSNHDTQRVAPILKAALEASGRFTVDVENSPPAYGVRRPERPGKNATPEELANFEKITQEWIQADRDWNGSQTEAWEKWRPDFKKYKAIINNYNGRDWSPQMKEDFVKFVSDGGGLVNVHEANNGFANWEDFNKMISLGFRGNKGRRIVVDGETGDKIELAPGSETGQIGETSGHGGIHEFVVVHRDRGHPILANLPASWLHGRDELYHGQRGLAENLNILASAFSDPKHRGSGKHEPVLWWTEFGKGKVVTTSLGHLWYNQEATDAVRCVGFQTILARSAEWVATGKVTLPVPDGFPSAHQSSIADPKDVKWEGAASSIKNYKKGEQRFKALSPEESQKLIELPKGYHAELVANEPMIEEAVWAAWDGNGAMYVAEMNSYMQDAHGTGTKTDRNGRIKRLEDTDGDGRMDKVTIFADNLLLPRMILPLDERILVQETYDGSFYSFRDTNGDGVSDEKVLIWKGGTPQSSVEHQDSALTWNVDNWIYTAAGGTRHRFTRGKWETERTLTEFNQWGMGMDDTGVQFYSQNAIPGRSFQQPWYAWNLIGEKTGWKKFERPSLGKDTDGAFQKIYPLFPVGDRSETMGGSWTSACGLSIYRGDALPEEMRGTMMLSEPCSHLVRRASITRTDAGTTLKNLDPFTEFFLSRDFYTRPVSTHTGPDGCLYIVDMYRGIIQDSPWVSGSFITRLEEMGMDQVKNRGRIYRITHDSIKPSKPPRLLDAKPVELVPYLNSANGWIRDTAQKLLILRADRSVIPALQELAKTGKEPLGRMHALWALEGLDALELPLLTEKLKDADARVREAAVRQHEPWLKKSDAAAITSVLGVSNDLEPVVKRQLVLSLGWCPDKKAVDAIQEIAEKNLTSGQVFLATSVALHGQTELPFVKKLQDGSLFKTIEDPKARSAAQSRWKAGLESWKGVPAEPRHLDPEAMELVQKGTVIYETVCSTCHGEDGKGVAPPGVAPLAPPLAGSAFVLGPKEALGRVLLHGLTGPLEGKEYSGGLMAPLGQPMPDEWNAAVLTYIRQEWVNNAAPIRTAEVTAIRKASESQQAAFTEKDLEAWAAPLLTDQTGWVPSSNSSSAPTLIDGTADSYQKAWRGKNDPNTWVAMDFGKPVRLTHLVMENFLAAETPEQYEVQISDDGKKWSEPIATGQGTGLKTMASFEPVVTKHIRINQTGKGGGSWMISELHFYGKPVE